MNSSCRGVLIPTQIMSGFVCLSTSMSFAFFRGGQVPEWRSIRSRDSRPWEPAHPRQRQFQGDPLLSSVKEVRIAGELGAADDFMHQIRPGNLAIPSRPCIRPTQTIGLPSGTTIAASAKARATDGSRRASRTPCTLIAHTYPFCAEAEKSSHPLAARARDRPHRPRPPAHWPPVCGSLRRPSSPASLGQEKWAVLVLGSTCITPPRTGHERQDWAGNRIGA